MRKLEFSKPSISLVQICIFKHGMYPIELILPLFKAEKSIFPENYLMKFE